ncbi:hypothetical protein H0H93_009015 [Arthromyces matolae]|nr:hypothetical protein H0H93_009015 [Arthromyces matolae]
MAHFTLEGVIRPNILGLHPYRCARDDYQSGVLLDANENALGHSIADEQELGLHRYPDPSHPQIKSRIAQFRDLPGPDHVFLGVGSDEIIDLLQRIAVVPSKQKILITPPTYGMYSVNDVAVVKVPLELTGTNGEGGENGRFSVNVDAIKQAVLADPSIRLIFLCSPGNPTGTSISISSITSLLDFPSFTGLVVVDEAYIDFTTSTSAASLISSYPNLVVMQTFSKAFGLAAIRVGIALAQPPLIQILTNTKAPYNISSPTAQLALAALSPESLSLAKSKIATLNSSRTSLIQSLKSPSLADLGVGPIIGSNEANFVLVRILSKDTSEPDNKRAFALYKALAEEKGVVVRYRGTEIGCEGALRVTVGTESENAEFLARLKEVLSIL